MKRLLRHFVPRNDSIRAFLSKNGVFGLEPTRNVIANAVKQSPYDERLLRRFAPRNDGLYMFTVRRTATIRTSHCESRFIGMKQSLVFK
ncbi:MAG: hypothetical protein V1779_10210 [bacterium]